MPEVLHTAYEWMDILEPDTQIYDPDGWRGPNGRDMNDSITEEEFTQRFVRCTVGPRLKHYADA